MLTVHPVIIDRRETPVSGSFALLHYKTESFFVRFNLITMHFCTT